MDVKAIVVLGPSGKQAESIGGLRYGLADVLGKPVVYRVMDSLKSAGVNAVTIVTEEPQKEWPGGTAARGTWVLAGEEQLWRTTEHAFEDYSHEGADLILVVRLGCYTELDYNDLIQFHTERNNRITVVVDAAGTPLDVYAITGTRRNDAAFLFRHRLGQFRSGREFYTYTGYVNRLASPYDLRNLAIDALMQRIKFEPCGEEIKPGVWVGRGAKIHRRARVLGPSFIGAGARVRAAAVVTRCSALERHTVVDCGTVLENVSTLPFTYVGAGLDVARSIVGRSRVWNLKRGVEVEFSDPRLIGEASANAPLRAVGSFLSLASFFPAQILRGLFAPSHRECPASLPEAVSTPAAALEVPAQLTAAAPVVDAREFPANLVIARRYGNE
jgi:NDP-sugar pyrophosphorylase family protein